ncbi:hypothetical protein [Stutzerimonas chloritidismutans]
MRKMNNQEQFVHRAGTVIITLREVIQDFSEPECLLLKLSEKTKKKALDVGSLAYFMSGKNESIHDGRSTPVVISSFVEGRRELVVRLLESFAGMRDETVLQLFNRTKYFVNWLNSSGYRELFASEAQAQEAYRDFTAHLNHRICMRELKPRSANQYQDGAINVIKSLYPEDFHYILSGAIRIIAGRGSAVPSDSHVQLYKDVCLAIAKQCSEFVLSFNSYPCVVSIRDYEVVLFPSHVGAVGPFKARGPAYNAEKRRIATAEEYMAACEILGRQPSKEKCIAKVLRDSAANLAVSNEDARHWHRLYLASLAAKAYVVLFMLITGASPTEFAQFTYEDALEVKKSPLKKEFSAVKFRAGGKATIYNIGRENGLPLLKEYLKLREWILDGESFDKLFFSTPKLTPRKDRQGFGELPVTGAMRSLYESISGVFLDSNVPNLSARKMRKHKSNVEHSARLSPATVSASLNHTEAVNLSTYAEATPEQQKSEFGRFWQSVRHAATIVRERSEKSSVEVISTAAGHCDAFNQPATSSDSSASVIEPNCRTQYGCLYCEHYVCHSDEEDLHKLMSLQYVISAVRNAAPDTAHAEALYRELSIRIEFIIDALGERSESVRQIVDIVKTKVFEYGMLTPFWEIRLGRYEKMGLVT